jgi:hypothetical protein
VGIPPGFSGDVAWTALGTIECLWPELIDMMLSLQRKGKLPLAGAVDKGLLLAKCRVLRGFPGVLARLKEGQRAAYSEFVFAAALVKLGYWPTFEPEVGAQRPISAFRSRVPT